MPFTCLFQLNNDAINKSDEIIFLEYIDSSFDRYSENPIRLANININGIRAFIYSNCPCYVSSKGEIKNGEKVTESTIIGYFSANGEDIPYDRPYAIIKG